jgi:hypothetical protein
MILRPAPIRWSLVLAAALSLATPGHAQDDTIPPPLAPRAAPAAPVSADPDHPAFGDLIDAINEVVDRDATLAAMSATIAREYAQIHEIAALESVKPGLIDVVIEAMMPVLRSYSERIQQEYRPQMKATLAYRLTPAEAMDIAAFYRSPTGRKLMSGVSRNTSMESTLSGISDAVMTGKDPADITIGSAQVKQDITGAAQAGVEALSEDELIDLGRLALEKPALLKLNSMVGDIIALRTSMENEQPTAEENAAIEAAVITAVTRHLGG